MIRQKSQVSDPVLVYMRLGFHGIRVCDARRVLRPEPLHENAQIMPGKTRMFGVNCERLAQVFVRSLSIAEKLILVGNTDIELIVGNIGTVILPYHFLKPRYLIARPLFHLAAVSMRTLKGPRGYRIAARYREWMFACSPAHDKPNCSRYYDHCRNGGDHF